MQQSFVSPSATSSGSRNIYLHMGDQREFFQNIKLVQLEETEKVDSHCVPDEKGRQLRDNGRIRGRWVPFFRSLLKAKSDILDPDIPKRLPRQPVAGALGAERTEGEVATAMKVMADTKAVGPDGLETRTSTRPDHLTGAPPTYHPHLAQGKSPTTAERRGYYHTPQEGR